MLESENHRFLHTLQISVQGRLVAPRGLLRRPRRPEMRHACWGKHTKHCGMYVRRSRTSHGHRAASDCSARPPVDTHSISLHTQGHKTKSRISAKSKLLTTSLCSIMTRKFPGRVVPLHAFGLPDETTFLFSIRK